MFSGLTEKLRNIISSLGREKKLSEENLADAVRQVRLALLEADVNYGVASRFVQRVKEKVVGDVVLKSVTPTQQFIKIVHDELVSLMGGEEAALVLQGSPAVILLCGLQGSGKTTTCAKLGEHLKRKSEKETILLVACDLQRPAAVEQLRKLGAEISLPVFSVDGEKDPLRVVQLALEKARKEGFDVVIIDTAGRLHLDEELMGQLQRIKELVQPCEVLFVANASTGQDAVKTAAEFNQRIAVTGTVLTMLDGNTRAGAAISIREVTQKPLKFEGVGEKIGDLQVFNPRSMADRILGMGDIINLVRKAQESFDEKESLDLQKKLRSKSFTYEDFLQQMKGMRKAGPLKGLLKMLPGASELGDLEAPDKEFGRMEAMISSMTLKERQKIDELSIPRKKRIARGSGTHIDEVNRMVKSFKRMEQIASQMPQMKQSLFKGGIPNMKQLKDKMEEMKWHS